MSFSVPRYSLVTPYMQKMFQTEAVRQFTHTYTRLSRTPIVSLDPDSDVDEWGQPTYTFPAPVQNLPCYYQQRSRPIVQPYGLMSANVPMLYVPMGDLLKRGDWVEHIWTMPDPETGQRFPLLIGPVEVEDTSPGAPNVDGWVMMLAQLREIKIVPDGAPPR